jgi:hypothetical protein
MNTAEVLAKPSQGNGACDAVRDLFSALHDGTNGESRSVLETDISSPGETVVADAERSAEVPAGLGFTAYWRQYMETVVKAEDDIKSILDRGQRVFGKDYATGEAFSGWQLLRKTRSEIVSSLVQKAEREFAPPGGSLEIGVYDAVEMMPEGWDKTEDECFDPDQLWRVLEAKYGGDYGVELGRTQLASQIVSAFRLGKNPPVRKANRLELSDTIYSEKKFHGGVEMSYSTVGSVCKLHAAMAAFCEWAGDYETARRLQLRSEGLYRNHDITSRERFDMGGIGYVTFHTSMQWEIYGELGDKFQAFISKYGREALERGRP